MNKKISSSQVLVDTTLRTKRGPYNKLSKKNRLDKVRKLYFEEGYSIVDVAKTLGMHRNTATSDVKYWIGQFEKQGSEDEITEFFYKQKSLFESQKFRLLKKLNTESDLATELKIEKILLGLYDKEMKFYLKFMPMVKKSSKVSKKLVKKIIRELAFDGSSFLFNNYLTKEIIGKIKCDVDTANSIVSEMQKLGLDYTRSRYSEPTSMLEFAKLCGYLSDEEYSKIRQEKARREEQEEQEYQKRLSEYNEKFAEKFGDSENWSDEVKKKHRRGLFDLG